MITRRAILAGAAIAAARRARAQQMADPLPLVQVVELTGPGSLVGDSWRNGVEMALQDIDARGGILGRPLELTTFDAHSGSGIHAVVQRALEGEPFALIGPATSTDALASLPAGRAARVMHVVGGESAALTAQNDPTVMRAGIGQALALARLIAWARDTLRPTRLALVCDAGETGRAAHDIVAREARARGIDVSIEVAPQPRQTEFAGDIPRIARAGADAVFLWLGELETAHFLSEARAQSLQAALLCSPALITPRVLKLAGSAANGARTHAGEAIEAPSLADFRTRYLSLFKQPADGAAIRGHVAVGMVKAATDKLGRADPQALADALRGQTITTDREPAILFDSRWDQAGNIDHASSILEIQDNRAVLIKTIPIT